MKSAQKHTPAANIQQKANAPFFQAKESEASSNERTFFTKNDQAKPSFLNSSSPTIQAKLNIGQPGDKYEREADAVADRVVSNQSALSPLSDTPSASPIQRKCSDCEQKEKLQKKEGEEEVGQADSDLQLKPIFDSGQEPPEENISNIQTKCDSCGKDLNAIEGVINIQKKEIQELPQVEEEKTEPVSADKKEESKPKPQGGENKTKNAGLGSKKIELPEIERKKEEQPEIQQKTNTPNVSHSKSNIPLESSLKQSKGNGSPLDNKTRGEMEGQFGNDFSQVRIHNNSSAVQMNQQLGAKAFTNQQDIYFNAGEYDTQSIGGKKLLAHELTHTIQQGGTGNSVQKFEEPNKKVEPETAPPNPHDGVAVTNRMDNKMDNDPNVQDGKDLSEEEKNEKKNPDRNEVRQESKAINSSGESSPDVDRGAEATVQSEEQKGQVDEQVNEETKEGTKEEEKGIGEENSLDTAEADMAGQKSAEAEALAKAVVVPDEPEPFKQPLIEAPVDSDGQPLPRNATNDTAVRGLGAMGEMFRSHGYQMKQHAAEKEIHAHGLDAIIEKEKEELALAKKGTTLFKKHNESRKETSIKAKDAHQESDQKRAFVEEKAPDLAKEAAEGQKDSGALSSDAKAKAEQSKNEIHDDPDAKADAEKQSAEMNETADGAESMDQAIMEVGNSANQYIEDAKAAAADNELAFTQILETDALIVQTDAKLLEIDAANQNSQAQIENATAGPDLIRQHSRRTAQSGDELIAASIVMEIELNSLQDEYLAKMASIEKLEDAQERAKKEAEENQEEPDEQSLSPEEMELFDLAGMDEEEMEHNIAEMDEGHKNKLLAVLDQMITFAPDQGTDESEGKRIKVDTGLNQMLDTHEADPRAADIQDVENQRTQRLGGVLDIADQNMGFLTVAQQAMLADKLVADSVTDDIKNISVLKMGKEMLKGMVDPRMSLQGVVGGFEKTLSGFANIGNLEAWKKDPIGNFLQIGADISTGVAMILSSVLGLAAIITAFMVALVIFSWGALALPLAPAFAWMGTVMTYAGWGAMIAGSLSVYFNSLAYIKNLYDAATAPTARELLGNVGQMKQNTTDGFQGLMAIGAGFGAAKMGPKMSSGDFLKAIPKSPKQFAIRTLQNAKALGGSIAKLPGRAAQGMKRLFQGGRKGLINFKNKFVDLFRKRKNKGGSPNTHNGVKRIDPDSPYYKDYDIAVKSDGHTFRRKRDGTWCRFSAKKCGLGGNDLPANVKKRVRNISPPTKKLSKGQRKFEAEIQKKVDSGKITPDEANQLRQFNEANPSGTTRNIDNVLNDIRNPNLEFNPQSGRFRNPNRKQNPTPDTKVKVTDDFKVDHSNFSKKRQKQLKQIVEGRKKAMRERDMALLERDKHRVNSPEYLKYDKRVRKFETRMKHHSENLGTVSTHAYVEAKFPGHKKLDFELPGKGKQGQFDMVIETPDGKIYIIESKGGGATRGSAVDKFGNRVEQGTPEYRNYVVDNMKKSTNPNVKKTAFKIEEAIEDGNIHYEQVSQKVGTGIGNKGDLIDNAHVSQFDPKESIDVK